MDCCRDLDFLRQSDFGGVDDDSLSLLPLEYSGDDEDGSEDHVFLCRFSFLFPFFPSLFLFNSEERFPRIGIKHKSIRYIEIEEGLARK